MDDTELTKKAIEELLRDMDDGREMGGLPTERKINPLGKPNKRFWTRTINSVVKHNERQIERNYRGSQRKLRELDAKQKKQVRRQTRRNHEKIRRHSQTESLYEYMSSANEGNNLRKEKKRRKVRKIKRKEKKQKSSSSSSSSSNSSVSSSSSDSESGGSAIKSKGKKYKKIKKERHANYSGNDENEELYPEIMEHEPNVSYYIDPHIAYTAMAYGHINHVLHQQQLLQQQTIKDELEESVEIPSDLSISHHSESSLNISLRSSSVEEDESGILTFKLLSSDEERQSPNSKRINTKRKERNENHNIITLVESDDSDQSSIKSYISLESATSSIPNSQTNEILLLSSSTSDCDDIELIETISESAPKESNLENIEKQYSNALIEYETKSSVNEIQNISYTNENNSPKNKIEAKIKSKSGENEISKELEMEQTVQFREPINENEINKFGNAGELDKINDVTRYHDGSKELNKNEVEIQENFVKTKNVDDKELENIEDYKEKVKDANELKSRMSPNHINAATIDLTEE